MEPRPLTRLATQIDLSPNRMRGWTDSIKIHPAPVGAGLARECRSQVCDPPFQPPANTAARSPNPLTPVAGGASFRIRNSVFQTRTTHHDPAGPAPQSDRSGLCADSRGDHR